MNLLCLDTSSRTASIAVLDDEKILLEYNFTSSDNLSAMLVPSLEFLLRSLAMKLSQVDVFAAAVGPGLFTGIRIGLATLKGLNFAAAKPMVGVNTLEALASKFSDSQKTIVPLINAGKGEVYLGCYRYAGDVVSELIQPCLLPISALVAPLQPFADKVFIGSGVDGHEDFLSKTFPGSTQLQRSGFLAGEVGKIGWQRFRRLQYVTDPQKLLPVYIRKPDAENNLPRPSGAVD